MHDEVIRWVENEIQDRGPFASVVEIGGRNINGTVRPLFGDADYTSVDLVQGSGVDVVADAREWRPTKRVTCVVCCNVCEHSPTWPALIDAAHQMLRKGGVLLLSAASTWPPHSAVDGGELRPDEHYADVQHEELEAALEAAGFSKYHVEADGPDVRAVAVR